jgi:hypothetical protein
VLQATSPARTEAGFVLGSIAGQSGQYLPGLAPATELSRHTFELRQQHLTKLQRLAGTQLVRSTGHSPGIPLSLSDFITFLCYPHTYIAGWRIAMATELSC